MTFLTQTQVSCRPTRTRRLSFFRLMSLYRQRRALTLMSDEQLKDLGLTRDQAMAESRRPLWDNMINVHIRR